MTDDSGEPPTFTFHGWKYGHYFNFESVKNEKNITVRCKLCVGRKLLSTAKNTTSNLLKHLEKVHNDVKLVEKYNVPVPDDDDRTDPPAAKQQKLDFTKGGMTQRELNMLVAEHVVEDMVPLSTVDSPSFRKIIQKIPVRPDVKLPQRKGFTTWLDKEYVNMECKLKATLGEVNFVSTTADIWTANNKSFLGVTVHWISSTTLERHKAAIACKRIRGRHTFDLIGSEIEHVHSTYGLVGKVVATVTDNASNFAKAFRVYQPAVPSSDAESEGEEEQVDEEDDVTFTDVTELLSVDEAVDAQITLPPHYRCASHTINLISTTDVKKHLESSTESRAVYMSSMAKCSGLWTKASRSTVAAEAVEEASDRKLLVPSSTRWNSLYEAVCRVIEINAAERNSLCLQFGIRCMSEKEVQFLQEYCVVMKPLTGALDILQGDNCHYGSLLPTIEKLIRKTLDAKGVQIGEGDQAVIRPLSRMTAALPGVIVKVSQYSYPLCHPL